nr:glycosyltransferase [Micromonospora sp. DSM 115978]
MRWLVFGTYDVRRHPRVGVLIEGLRDSGDDVVEVNAPLLLDTAARVAMLKQPWRLPVLAWKLAACWTSLIRQARRRRDQPVDAVLVGYLGHFDVRLARRLFRRTPIVLDHLISAAGTARDRGLADGGGIKGKLMRSIDAGALRSANLVVVDTAEHLAALPDNAIDRGVVAPVGAGAEWYAAARPAGERGDGPLRVIFVGLFTPLHGTTTLGEALALLAGDERIEITMVGTGQDHAECRRLAAANPRITWIDWVAGADLPALVAGHDVSLGIFGTTAKAQNVVPTKVFQGAAARCAIVTSGTPPQRQMLGDAALFVPPGDAEALADALRELAADPARLAELKAAAAARAAARFAPATVVAPVRDRLAAAPAATVPPAATAPLPQDAPPPGADPVVSPEARTTAR